MCACVRLRPSIWLILSFAVAMFGPARESAAHAKLQTARPAADAQLNEPPSEIKLSFTEPIEVRLSTIAVRDRSSERAQTVHASAVAGDRRSVAAPLTPLQPGVYVVDWRVVSADGHAMTGSYTFTIRGRQPQAPAATPPADIAPAPASPPRPGASRTEIAARWLFLAGAAVLLGTATASAATIGGEGDLAVATVGWAIAALGIVLLGEAQRRTALTTAGELLGTSIGHALLGRAAALAGAAVALIAARTPSRRRGAMVLAAACVLASIVVHAAAGHAAAIEVYPVAAIGLQSLHFAAAGVWFGGLAALLAGTRGGPDTRKTAAVRRYSSLAAFALAIVGATGVLRTAQELSSWQQLIGTDYGQAALAKALLLIAIAGFGALNRWRSVPAAATDLWPLRRFALIELVLMTVALGVAAILATLAPPG
jgi:copper transport protein